MILANSKKYTLDVAEAMPADGYDFKPAGTAWSFRELLHHIAYGIHWWEQNYVKAIEIAWDPPPTKNNKSEIIFYLQQVYSSFTNSISTLTTSNDLVKGFHATIDHITHHRGQATLYLRCRGINPPEYLY